MRIKILLDLGLMLSIQLSVLGHILDYREENENDFSLKLCGLQALLFFGDSVHSSAQIILQHEGRCVPQKGKLSSEEGFSIITALDTNECMKIGAISIILISHGLIDFINAITSETVPGYHVRASIHIDRIGPSQIFLLKQIASTPLTLGYKIIESLLWTSINTLYSVHCMLHLFLPLRAD